MIRKAGTNSTRVKHAELSVSNRFCIIIHRNIIDNKENFYTKFYYVFQFSTQQTTNINNSFILFLLQPTNFLYLLQFANAYYNVQLLTRNTDAKLDRN